MVLKIEKKGETVKLHLPEVFGFSIRNEFRSATTNNPSGTRYVLDFKDVIRMDSAALGMMLLLREGAGGISSKISLINARNEISKILHLANFHTLFNMS